MKTTLAAKVAQETEIRHKLRALVGKQITVSNNAYDQSEDGKLQFSMEGTLEDSVDEDPNFHLRVKECHNGTSSLCFCEVHVLEIYKQPSGRVCVTLK